MTLAAGSAIRLGVVVPCYNEQEVLPETDRRLRALLSSMESQGLITADSQVCYVDDGSADTTWSLIESLAAADSRIHGIKLSGNRGHQNALLAGLFSVDADAIVSIDADLQDDVSAIEEMVRHFIGGAEIVYGVRSERTTDTMFKRSTAVGYYKLLRKFGVKLVHNHADFRLMGRRAIDALKQYSEVNLFLRGIVPMLGYRTETVYYARAERFAGESKYPFRKMLAFAIEGITSFSVVPLRLITMLGFTISLLSFLMIIVVIYGRYFTHNLIPGWASSVVPIYFLGGIQLLCIGILGEYVAKIYLETKARPRYFIEKVC
jgi:glycosyltransferase involved in cell wall biosynthesis